MAHYCSSVQRKQLGPVNRKHRQTRAFIGKKEERKRKNMGGGEGSLVGIVTHLIWLFY